jgi:hypothetical protein
MTMPHERARALRFAGEVLRDLQLNPDVPESVKREARVTLRHYPEPHELKSMIEAVDRLTRSGDCVHWLEPEPPK